MRIALVLALALPLAAQEPAAKPAAKAPSMADMMAKPGPEMAKLRPFMGVWEVEEIHEPGPFGPGGKGHGKGYVTEGPGGLSLMIDYRSLGGPMKSFRGHGVLGWDEPSKSYRQTWVDNMMPMMMVSTGHWDGDKFIMESAGTMMGKPFKGQDTFSGISKEGYTITGEMSMDGGPMVKMMTLIHRRAAKAEPKPEAKVEPKTDAKK